MECPVNDARNKLPTIKKYMLYWTINWWYGEKSGKGFLLCTFAILQLWHHCSQGAQKITCNINWEKSASTQNWWIGGRWGIVFFTVGSLVLWYDVSALSGKWILPAALSESSEQKTNGKCYSLQNLMMLVHNQEFLHNFHVTRRYLKWKNEAIVKSQAWHKIIKRDLNGWNAMCKKTFSLKFGQFHGLQLKCKNLYENKPNITKISTPQINSTHLLHCQTNITPCQRSLHQNIHTTGWHLTIKTAKEDEKREYECNEIIIYIHACDCLKCYIQ